MAFDPDLTLLYQFAANKTLAPVNGLGPTPSITRADATASRFNAQGTLETNLSANTARFDHDPVTFKSLGLLLEEARTNLAIRSGDVSDDAVWVPTNITKGSDSVTDPTGTANTNVRLTASAANGTLLQTVTSAIDDYSYAVFIRRATGTGDIDLTVDNGVTWTTQALTPGWNRFDVSDASETNPVFGVRIVTSGDAIDFWGSDLNKNTIFPTSHIPTVAASVTRNADVVSTTDVSWYNANEGSFYGSVSQPYIDASAAVFSVGVAAGSDRIRTLTSVSKLSLDVINSADTNGFVVDTDVMVDGIEKQFAFAFANDDMAGSFDGGSIITDADVSMPLAVAPDIFAVGDLRAGGAPWNGHIKELRYYNVRKDNQFLEDLSNGLIAENAARSMGIGFIGTLGA